MRTNFLKANTAGILRMRLNEPSIGRKVIIIAGTTIISAAIASFYGIIHNQITYSISDEYFTRYAFDQFGLWEAPTSQNRFMAGYIGLIASWWFGALTGMIISVYVLFLSQLPKVLSMIRKGVVVVVAVTFLFGLIGYGVGVLLINDMGMDLAFINSLEDSKAFVTAGSIHNFTYLGAILGLIGTMVALVTRDKRTKQ